MAMSVLNYLRSISSVSPLNEVTFLHCDSDEAEKRAVEGDSGGCKSDK